MSVIEAITSSLAPIVAAAGVYLEEVTLEGGSPRLLTVVIDGDRPLNLDQVTVVTKEISEILENLPELGEHPFTLEVTTPGTDRALTLPRHWRKNQGRLVTATLINGLIKKGRIGEQAEQNVVIDGEVVALADISLAQIEIEFKSLNKGEQE